MLIEPHEQEQPAKDPKDSLDSAPASEGLALLYQGLFTGIVRIKARRQHITDGESFRRRTKATLQEVERFAAAAGYESKDVQDTHFAVVAFLDSVVLHSNDPVRAEWERKPLQEELFGQTDAGVVFFEKLEQFYRRRSSTLLADILEVYLLCLLLGFEGRYSGGLRGEIDGIAEKVRNRIDGIRQIGGRLSPSPDLPHEPAEPAAMPSVSKRFRAAALAAAIFTIILFLLLLWNLSEISEQVRTKLT
jgi:type VI secretion system protein ImpK